MASDAATNLLEGETGSWEVVIGMEVHAQVVSEAKLFSGASTAFGGAPNDHVSLVDAAMPGMLPVINAECVRQAVRTGLGLKAQINLNSVFDRKNYFYPDLPQGYQISQYQQPVVGEGEVVVDMPGGETVAIGIERLHLEQDAGKSLHDQRPDHSLVDLNRSGVALMEIVSKPDIRSAEQAKAYVSKLRSILRYLGTCDGNMEEGSLRADINVSVHKPGTELGTRCEIKNVNSIRFIGQAVDYEARRQIEVLEEGGAIEQETRLFDPKTGETRSMRTKEEAHDYRYFPDPDLVPLELSQAQVDELAADLPELPDEKKARFERDYGLNANAAESLTADKAVADYYEEVVVALNAPRGLEPQYAWQAAQMVLGELFGRLNKLSLTIEQCPVSPERLAELLRFRLEKTISGRMAKQVLDIMFETSESAEKIIETRDLKQVTDTGALEAIVDEIVAANPKQVAQVAKNPKTLGWFVGQVMQATGGKANPKAVNEILRQKLDVGEG